MAAYADLYGLISDDQFKKRIAIACVVAADAIRTEAAGTANHAARMVWAKQAAQDPLRAADGMFWALVAQNRTATIEQIVTATDATLQTAVNSAVNLFAQ